MRFALQLAVAIFLFRMVLAAVAADLPTPWTAEQRAKIDSRLRVLDRQLAEVRPAGREATIEADRWADVDIFRKGVRWALRWDETVTSKDVELVEKSLSLGLARAEGLARGTMMWQEARGRLVRGYVSAVDGSTQPYGLVVPSGYDPSGSKPVRLDVVLHGSSKPVGLSELRFMDRFAGNNPPPDVDYIELHPLGRVENCYRWAGETDVFEAIEAVCRNYRIDRDRIVLRGMSMGASGTWHLGLKHPDRFVALGPYCGYVDTYHFSRTPLPNFIPVPELPSVQKSGLHLLDSVDYAANASVVPAIAAIGEKDVFFGAHVLMREALEREGLPMVNLISPGTGHVIDPPVHAEQMRRIAEHAQRGLDRTPRRLRFVTWTLKYSQCHWLQLLALDQHLQRAEIKATRLDGDDTIEISQLDNIRTFAIDASRFPKFPTTIRIHDQSIPLEGAGRVYLTRTGKGWRQLAGDDSLFHTGKRPGLQGPVDDAFGSRFLCVRGTGQPWHEPVQKWADARLAAFTSEWSQYFRGELPVKRDDEVTAEDLAACHLILFGDPGSNSWIAKALATSQLPIVWTREEIRLGSVKTTSADHVPVLIQPNPLTANLSRYVVFNTGHTFGAAELGAVNYLLFPRLGDWAVLKADPFAVRTADPRLFVDPTVVDTGYFDESWK